MPIIYTLNGSQGKLLSLEHRGERLQVRIGRLVDNYPVYLASNTVEMPWPEFLKAVDKLSGKDC